MFSDSLPKSPGDRSPIPFVNAVGVWRQVPREGKDLTDVRFVPQLLGGRKDFEWTFQNRLLIEIFQFSVKELYAPCLKALKSATLAGHRACAEFPLYEVPIQAEVIDFERPRTLHLSGFVGDGKDFRH